MSTPFQNRLVGTVIVAAAAVIFLPDILDGEKRAFQQQFEEIPKKPEFVVKQDKKDFPDAALEELNAPQPVVEVSAQDDLLSPPQDKKENDEVDIAKVNANDNEIEDADPVTATEAKTENIEPAESSSESTIAWAIQIGSFKDKTNVAALITKLKNAGFTPYTRRVNSRSGQLTQVFVGPEVNKELLTKKLKPLEALISIKGKVIKYNPN